MPRTISSFRAALAAALVLAATALPARSASAQTATLNFNTLTDPSGGTVTVPNSYTESGYLLTAVGDVANDPLSFATYGANDGGFTGSPALFLNSATATDVNFARQGGGLFSFQSVDLATFMAGDTTQVMFRGFTPGSGSNASVFRMFTITGPQSFSMADFTGFTGLSSMSMSAMNQYSEPIVQFDNVGFTGATSTVPEPATFGLVATGLIGMAGAVRRRSARKTPPSA